MAKSHGVSVSIIFGLQSQSTTRFLLPASRTRKNEHDDEDTFAELPPAAARTLFHTRQTQFQGYQREDGLWDVEAQMVDTKPFDFDLASSTLLPASKPLHHMLIRLTLGANFTVVDIASSIASYTRAICDQVDRHMQRMVGCNMAKGWRKAIEENLGKVEGRSHMRELLFNMATVVH